MESENRSRSLHNLPEVSRERSAAPLLFRSRARPRLGALAKARTDPCETERIFHTCQQMGPTKSNNCGNGCACADPLSGGEHGGLEKRDGSPSDADWHALLSQQGLPIKRTVSRREHAVFTLARGWRLLPAWPECSLWVCAVTRRRFPVGANPTRQPLQKSDIRAVRIAFDHPKATCGATSDS